MSLSINNLLDIREYVRIFDDSNVMQDINEPDYNNPSESVSAIEGVKSIPESGKDAPFFFTCNEDILSVSSGIASRPLDCPVQLPPSLNTHACTCLCLKTTDATTLCVINALINENWERCYEL